jgi:hypothetical protein
MSYQGDKHILRVIEWNEEELRWWVAEDPDFVVDWIGPMRPDFRDVFPVRILLFLRDVKL